MGVDRRSEVSAPHTRRSTRQNASPASAASVMALRPGLAFAEVAGGRFAPPALASTSIVCETDTPERRAAPAHPCGAASPHPFEKSE